ncbi:MAG: hypothetical protein JWR70_3428, partial [Modestobacter sp.]|nr:hypothetical protein [Modestobacter sp.]
PTPTMRLPQAAADEGEVREVRAGLVAAGLLRPTEDRGRHESAWHR